MSCWGIYWASITKGNSGPLFVIAVGTVLAAGLGSYIWYESRKSPLLEVRVFDTPGRPSVFIRTPDDKRVLIGGGSNSDIIRRLTSVLPFYSRHIDTIILPDTDPRNIVGLIEVVDRYKIDKVLVPRINLAGLGLTAPSDPAYGAFLETAKQKGLIIERISAGYMLDVDEKVSIEALFPVGADEFRYSTSSAPSMVLRMRYGSISIMYSGNASAKIQRFIARSGGIRSDALVVSGALTPSNYSSEFISAVSPDYLVYSQAVSGDRSGKRVTREAKDIGKKAGLLAGILDDHRFNIKKDGEVIITSDGSRVAI